MNQSSRFAIQEAMFAPNVNEAVRYKEFRRECLPKLVIAIIDDCGFEVRCPENCLTQFTPERKWHYIEHCTGGNGVHYKYLWCSILQVRPEVEEGLLRLAETYRGSNFGSFGTLDKHGLLLPDLMRNYQEVLRYVHPDLTANDVGLTQIIEEAFYPFDLSCLSLLSPETVDFTALVEPPNRPDERYMNLMLLTQNSD